MYTEFFRMIDKWSKIIETKNKEKITQSISNNKHEFSWALKESCKS